MAQDKPAEGWDAFINGPQYPNWVGVSREGETITYYTPEGNRITSRTFPPPSMQQRLGVYRICLDRLKAQYRALIG